MGASEPRFLAHPRPRWDLNKDTAVELGRIWRAADRRWPGLELRRRTQHNRLCHGRVEPRVPTSLSHPGLIALRA